MCNMSQKQITSARVFVGVTPARYEELKKAKFEGPLVFDPQEGIALQATGNGLGNESGLSVGQLLSEIDANMGTDISYNGFMAHPTSYPFAVVRAPTAQLA